MEKKKLAKEQLKLPDGSIQFYFINPSEKVAFSNKINRRIFVGSFFMSQLSYEEKVGIIYHELGHLSKIGYLLTLFQVFLFLFFFLKKFILISFFILFLFFWIEELYCDYYAKKKVGKIYILSLKKSYSKKSSFFNRFLLHPPIQIRVLFLNFF